MLKFVSLVQSFGKDCSIYEGIQLLELRDSAIARHICAPPRTTRTSSPHPPRFSNVLVLHHRLLQGEANHGCVCKEESSKHSENTVQKAARRRKRASPLSEGAGKVRPASGGIIVIGLCAHRTAPTSAFYYYSFYAFSLARSTSICMLYMLFVAFA